MRHTPSVEKHLYIDRVITHPLNLAGALTARPRRPGDPVDDR